MSNLQFLLCCCITFIISVISQECIDVPTGDGYSCEQQKEWGKCSNGWMKSGNYCAKTCGFCPPSVSSCTDTPTEDGYTCEQQKKWGKCSNNWMKAGNYCAKTCGFCKVAENGGVVVESASECSLKGDCDYCPVNIEGEVLILDYKSLYYSGGPNHPSAISDAASCCAKCKETQGCNAWVYCDNSDGCGEGCEAYVSDLSETPNPFEIQGVINLPLPNFGQFRQCNGDKYPNGMCSLKRISDVENPVSTPSVNEFISGVVKAEQGCLQGISQGVCNNCKQSKNPTACTDCVSGISLQNFDEQMYCSRCTGDVLSTDALKQQCIGCLQEVGGIKQGCGQCVKVGDGDIETCFKCSQGKDVDIQSGCFSCFKEWYYRNEDKCISECVQSDAIPAYSKSDCGDCYQTDDPARCLQCLQESTESDTQCAKCSTEECYTCLNNFADNLAGRKGCGSCQFVGSKFLPDCFDCVANEKISSEKKAACGDCQDVNSGITSGQRKQCVGCLERVNTKATKACSECIQEAYWTSKDPTTCLDCVATMDVRGSNALSCAKCEFQSNADNREKCYKCTLDKSLPVSIGEQCYKCFRQMGEKVDTEGCLQCLKTANTVSDAELCAKNARAA